MYADDSALGLLDVAAPSAAPTTSPRVPPIDVHPPGNLGNAAEAEADITMNITLREEYVARLDKLLSTASKAQLQKRLMKSLDLLDMLRMVTVDIIEAVVQWRHGLPKPSYSPLLNRLQQRLSCRNISEGLGFLRERWLQMRPLRRGSDGLKAFLFQTL